MKHRGTEVTTYERTVRAFTTINGKDYPGLADITARKDLQRDAFYTDAELEQPVEFVDGRGYISFNTSFSLSDEAAFAYLMDESYRLRVIIERVDEPPVAGPDAP